MGLLYGNFGGLARRSFREASTNGELVVNLFVAVFAVLLTYFLLAFSFRLIFQDWEGRL